jgi:hypothetical protein
MKFSFHSVIDVFAGKDLKGQGKAGKFDLRDLTLFIAAVVSLTLILVFLVIYLYYAHNREPLILIGSVTILSFFLSCSVILLLRANFAGEAGMEHREKLAQSLQEAARIPEEVSLAGKNPGGAVMMDSHYPATLIRTFAAGVGAAAVGILLIAVGAIGSHPGLQFGGSTILALGCVVLTLAVIHGENLDRQSFE